jgi:gamma-polyglutamate biosynthesis protein CapA
MEEFLSLACVGDIMCGDSFYALGQGVSSNIDKYGDQFLHTKIKNVFDDHDLVIGNIECPLSDIGRNAFNLRSLHMRGRARYAGNLADWGIKIANLANNHILEHGNEAAIDTAANLENAGIKTIGSSKNHDFKEGSKIVEICSHGIQLVFIGACLRREKYAYYGGATTSQVIDVVKLLSGQGKVVCVSLHWGNEFINRPSLEQKKIGHNLIDAGASVILGHHPHVVQGVEEYKHGLIAYSLGNFMFDSFYDDCRWSIILSFKINKRQVLEWKYLPIELDHEHRPLIAQGQRKNELESEVDYRCSLLQYETSDEQYDNQYNKDVAFLNDDFRKQLRKYLLKNIFKMKPVFWPQVLMRPVQRRLGWW